MTMQTETPAPSTPRTSRNGIWARIVEACRTRHGMSAAELSQMLGKPTPDVSASLVQMINLGHIHRVGSWGSRRYFSDKAQADAYEAERAATLAAKLAEEAARKVQRAQKGEPKKREVADWNEKRRDPVSVKPPRVLPRDLPEVIPPHVTVTVCPSGTDTRYAPDPSIAGRGVISQDYWERRLGQVQVPASDVDRCSPR